MQAFNNSSGLSLNTQGVLLDYSYRIPFGESASVALGIRGGFTTFTSIGTSQFYPYAGGRGIGKCR